MGFANAFNPYAETCDEHDTPQSALSRCQALQATLEAAAKEEVDAIWLGRDLGYLGGRRTGIAFTDDAHFGQHAERWGLKLSFERPTAGRPLAKERTATVVWGVLRRIDPGTRIFLWNVFPLHPHKPGNPRSNRRHNKLERDAGEGLLQELIALIQPRRLIAIGRDAAVTAARMKHCHAAVRHPSYGGHAQFVAQLADLYGLPKKS